MDGSNRFSSFSKLCLPVSAAVYGREVTTLLLNLSLYGLTDLMRMTQL